MQGENPMEGAGWGGSGNRDRERFSERDPALGRPRKGGGSRLPMGALLVAVIGIAVGTVGGVLTDPGDARFDITVGGGAARAGFGVAILAGLWISFGSSNRAPGARQLGVLIAVLSVLLLIVFA